MAGKTASDPSLTRVIPERFRDEYRTHYKLLYKCPLYLLTCLTCHTLSSADLSHGPADDQRIKILTIRHTCAPGHQSSRVCVLYLRLFNLSQLSTWLPGLPLQHVAASAAFFLSNDLYDLLYLCLSDELLKRVGRFSRSKIPRTSFTVHSRQPALSRCHTR